MSTRGLRCEKLGLALPLCRHNQRLDCAALAGGRGITSANTLGLVTLQEALSGFANATVWLIVAAFIFATGFRTTRLGERIAYLVIAAFGKSALRLGYSLVLADLLIAPVTPSNTARGGGVMFPVAQGIGLFKAFSGAVAAMVAGWQWPFALIALLVIYLYTHYAFASSAAHVTAMFPVFLGVAIAVGTPPLLAALSLAFFSSLYASLTHYGTGSALVLFGAGYVSQVRWWKIGFVVSLLHLVIWLGVGFAWWKVIGLW